MDGKQYNKVNFIYTFFKNHVVFGAMEAGKAGQMLMFTNYEDLRTPVQEEVHQDTQPEPGTQSKTWAPSC